MDGSRLEMITQVFLIFSDGHCHPCAPPSIYAQSEVIKFRIWCEMEISFEMASRGMMTEVSNGFFSCMISYCVFCKELSSRILKIFLRKFLQPPRAWHIYLTWQLTSGRLLICLIHLTIYSALSPLSSHNEQPRSMPLLRKLFYCHGGRARAAYLSPVATLSLSPLGAAPPGWQKFPNCLPPSLPPFSVPPSGAMALTL